MDIPVIIAGMSIGLLSANAKEVLGRGAFIVGASTTTGDGGTLLGQKITDHVSQMRNLPKGIDQCSACRHPDWASPLMTLR